MQKRNFSLRAVLVVITLRPFLCRKEDSVEIDELLHFLKGSVPKSALLVSTHILKLFPYFESPFFKEDFQQFESVIKIVTDVELKKLLIETWIQRHAVEVGAMLPITQMPHCVANK